MTQQSGPKRKTAAATKKVHTIEVTERELRVILTAFDIAREDTINSRAWWWRCTKYADDLYNRLLKTGLERNLRSEARPKAVPNGR